MFTSKQAITAREVGSAHAQLAALLKARDHWYDGTVASVDGRLSAITRALPTVERVALNDNALMAEVEKLRSEARKLRAFRQDLLHTPATPRNLPKVSAAGPLSQRGRRFIATEINQFLADNADVLDNPEELDARAQDHAEIATVQLPVTEARSVVAHFRLAVNWNTQNHRKRHVAAAPPKADLDFPDDALFD